MDDGKQINEMIYLLQSILAELKNINSNIIELKGYGEFSSVSDVYSMLEEIEGKLFDIESNMDY